MILRDFALYLTMILATFLVLALVFTFFELLTDIVRNSVPADHGGGISVEPEPVAALPDGADGGAAGGAHHLRPAG